MGSAWCTGSGFVVRRSALEQIGGFPVKSVAEDVLCSSMLLAGMCSQGPKCRVHSVSYCKTCLRGPMLGLLRGKAITGNGGTEWGYARIFSLSEEHSPLLVPSSSTRLLTPRSSVAFS